MKLGIEDDTPSTVIIRDKLSSIGIECGVLPVTYQDNKTVYFVAIDILLSKMRTITGQSYTWNYDSAGNILYINCAAGTLPLFD